MAPRTAAPRCTTASRSGRPVICLGTGGHSRRMRALGRRRVGRAVWITRRVLAQTASTGRIRSSASRTRCVRTWIGRPGRSCRPRARIGNSSADPFFGDTLCRVTLSVEWPHELAARFRSRFIEDPGRPGRSALRRQTGASRSNARAASADSVNVRAATHLQVGPSRGDRIDGDASLAVIGAVQRSRLPELFAGNPRPTSDRPRCGVRTPPCDRRFLRAPAKLAQRSPGAPA